MVQQLGSDEFNNEQCVGYLSQLEQKAWKIEPYQLPAAEFGAEAPVLIARPGPSKKLRAGWSTTAASGKKASTASTII
ncbi:MAG: hypothetical protein HY074_15675 [Deltaproteobacteria bacterium]|nr:hypothetical protein [Deltaproteobacteria bacterium]